MSMLKELLSANLAEIGLSLSDRQFLQLAKYYDLVIEKNKVMNLTAITKPEEFVIKHIVDSLSILRLFRTQNDLLLSDDTTTDIPFDFQADDFILLSANAPLSVIDVGTGAGFPGMVLKIGFPAWTVTLFDSLSKRVSFLQETIDILGLSGVSAVHGRAEDYGRNDSYREQYSLCVSRAVANISTLSEFCLPFVSVGGLFVAYKSGECDEEIESAKTAIEKLGGRIEKIDRFILPNSQDGRALVCIRKTASTPMKYPRKAGTPAKKPLK